MLEGNKLPHPALINTNIIPENTRILIVEDNKTNQIILKKIVEAQGYQTQIAENGQVALDIIAKCPLWMGSLQHKKFANWKNLFVTSQLSLSLQTLWLETNNAV